MRADSPEVGDLGLADHLQPMRMEEIEVADLIDRVGRSCGRLPIGARLPGDPGQIENARRPGDEFAHRQTARSRVEFDVRVGGGGVGDGSVELGRCDACAVGGSRDGHQMTLHPQRCRA